MMSIFGRGKSAPQSIGLHAKPSPLSEETAKNLGIERTGKNPLAAALAKLSTRERFLIIGLLIAAALTALVYFAVLPTMERVDILHDEIDTLTIQKDEMDAVIAQTAGHFENYELSKKDYNVYQEFFYPYLAPEDLDRMVTGMLMDANLDPTRLSMSSLAVEELQIYAANLLVPGIVPNYVSSEALGGSGAGGAGGVTDDEGATGDGVPTGDTTGDTTGDISPSEDSLLGSAGSLFDPAQSGTSSQVYVYTVDVAADGDAEALFSFLTTVYALHGIEVTSWSFQEPSSIVTNNEFVGPGSVNLQLKIYVFLGEPIQ
jgi:type II secretory pathway component PulM